MEYKSSVIESGKFYTHCSKKTLLST